MLSPYSSFSIFPKKPISLTNLGLLLSLISINFILLSRIATLSLDSAILVPDTSNCDTVLIFDKSSISIILKLLSCSSV